MADIPFPILRYDVSWRADVTGSDKLSVYMQRQTRAAEAFEFDTYLDIDYKMVKRCSFPGCTNREKPIKKRASASSMFGNERLTFFTFPLNDVERVKLWLLAIQRDVHLPLKVVKHLRLCSEHFTPDDFRPVLGNSRRLLNSTAVPVMYEVSVSGTLCLLK